MCARRGSSSLACDAGSRAMCATDPTRWSPKGRDERPAVERSGRSMAASWSAIWRISSYFEIERDRMCVMPWTHLQSVPLCLTHHPRNIESRKPRLATFSCPPISDTTASDAQANKSSASAALCALSLELHAPRSGASVGTASGAPCRPYRQPRFTKASKVQNRLRCLR